MIGNNRGKTLEKEKLMNRLTNERSLFATDGLTQFVKMNVRTNVRYLTKPGKKRTDLNKTNETRVSKKIGGGYTSDEIGSGGGAPMGRWG